MESNKIFTYVSANMIKVEINIFGSSITLLHKYTFKQRLNKVQIAEQICRLNTLCINITIRTK